MFNEQNTTEGHLIDTLKTLGWEYKKAEFLKRTHTDIFLGDILRNRIARLNNFESEQIDVILMELQKLCLQAEQVGLVSTNEIFARWLRNEVTMPFGKGGEHTEIKIIDYENIKNNKFLFTTQLTYKTQFEKRLDLVLFVNGIPIIVGECKSPVRPAVSWIDGMEDIQKYEQDITPFFVPNLFSFATEGKTFRYGAVGNTAEHWATWRAEENSKWSDLAEVEQSLRLMFEPENLLDLLANFAIFATTRKRKKVKILCRYQQFEAANKITEQVINNLDNPLNKQNLIWHFQGSGKSLLMVFTAMKLRKQAILKNPTIFIIVDRVDLDTQITATFQASDIPNTISTEDTKELEKFIEQGTQKIIITTIHKFAEIETKNERNNIIALIDEAHRTQEGDLARKMRTALPNAFWFGLTGTPINKKDKNTFQNFGGNDQLYLSKYTYEDAVRDKATLPLHFEPRLLTMHIQKDELDTAFEELTNDLETKDKALLTQKATNIRNWLKSTQRIETIVQDIIKHYQERISPNGFKAQVVCVDREACIAYKKAFDKLLGDEEASAVVMTINAKENEYKKYALKDDAEIELLDKFRDEKSNLKFLIVTNKLLTGFDAPILQVMYLDKTIKEHNLLQAICRTNRTYPKKTHGLIVDYIGVFSGVVKALDFDEEKVQESIKNIKELEYFLPEYYEQCMSYFEAIEMQDEKISFEMLLKAQEQIKGVELKDAFAKDYSLLCRTWEILSPNPMLNEYELGYKFLSQIYESVKPLNNSGKLLWNAYSEKTKKLIDQNIIQGTLNTDLEIIIMDNALLAELQSNPNTTKAKEFVFQLFARVKKHAENPKFLTLSIELELLKERAEKNQIDSLEFLKALVDYSKDLLHLEKNELNQHPRKTNKAINALTELFNDAKNENTPIIVENIVSDIDKGIVKYVKIEGWKHNSQAEKDVRTCLLGILKRYQLHKDIELYQKAYQYIQQHY